MKRILDKYGCVPLYSSSIFLLLPEPKVYHLTYTLSRFVGSITEEPCVGNLQARFCEGR